MHAKVTANATSNSWRSFQNRATCVFLIAGLLSIATQAAGQSASEWAAFKSANGLSPTLTYNDWVAAGCPLPSKQGSNAAQPGGGGLNAQQQVLLTGAYALGQFLHDQMNAHEPSPQELANQEQQSQAELAAGQLNRSGLYLMRQKNYRGAVHEFELALARVPGNQEFLANLAKANAALGKFERDSAEAAKTSAALKTILGDRPNSPNMPAGYPSPLSLVNLEQVSGSGTSRPLGSTATAVDRTQTPEATAAALSAEFDREIGATINATPARGAAQLNSEFDKIVGVPPPATPAGNSPGESKSAPDLIQSEPSAEAYPATNDAKSAVVNTGEPGSPAQSPTVPTSEHPAMGQLESAASIAKTGGDLGSLYDRGTAQTVANGAKPGSSEVLPNSDSSVVDLTAARTLVPTLPSSAAPSEPMPTGDGATDGIGQGTANSAPGDSEISNRSLATTGAAMPGADTTWVSDERTLVLERLRRPNPNAQEVFRRLHAQEPPLPYHVSLSELLPGDVLLLAPDTFGGKTLRLADRITSLEKDSIASHTVLFLRETNGKRFYLDNQPGQGPTIITEDEFLHRYRSRLNNSDLARLRDPTTLVAQPLDPQEAGRLWEEAAKMGTASAKDYALKASNYIDRSDYGLFRTNEFVCSTADHWVLVRATENSRPDLVMGNSLSPLKEVLNVNYGPANFYSDQNFLILPLGVRAP